MRTKELEEYYTGYAHARIGIRSTRKNPQYVRGWEQGVQVDGELVDCASGHDYFAQALKAITGHAPPFPLPSHGTQYMVEEDYLVLQDWASDHANPTWATGLSMIEAAELIVSLAVENGNIQQ